jgi:hypothetical protein
MASAPGYESAFNTQREESEEYPGRSLYVPTAVFATQPEEQSTIMSQQRTGPAVTGSKFSNPAITGYASTGARQWLVSVPLIYGGGDKMLALGGDAELPAVGGRAKVRDLQKEVEKENEVSTGMECHLNVPYAIFLDCAALTIIVGLGMVVRMIGEASDCWRQ